MEDLQILTAQVWDMVLHRADEPSSLAASLSMVVELLEGWVNAAAANRVRWGTWSALVGALLHFSELEEKLELLGSGCNTALLEDQVDALCAMVCSTSDFLASHVLPLVAHAPSPLMGWGSSSASSLRHYSFSFG
jgi:hypothetical protein